MWFWEEGVTFTKLCNADVPKLSFLPTTLGWFMYGTYADPSSKLETLKDAFDVAVQAVIGNQKLRWSFCKENRDSLH